MLHARFVWACSWLIESDKIPCVYHFQNFFYHLVLEFSLLDNNCNNVLNHFKPVTVAYRIIMKHCDLWHKRQYLNTLNSIIVYLFNTMWSRAKKTKVHWLCHNGNCKEKWPNYWFSTKYFVRGLGMTKLKLCSAFTFYWLKS
jgi:hypothetical protein